MNETLAWWGGDWIELTSLEAVAWLVADISWRASVLGLVALAVLTVGRRSIAPRWRFAVWALVLARFVVPWTPGAPWSLFGLWDAMPQAAAVAVATSESPDGVQAEVVGLGESTVRTANPLQSVDTTVARPAAVPRDAAEDAAIRVNWPRAAAILWLVVAAGFLVREVLLAIRLRRRLRGWRRADDPQLYTFYARCKSESGLARDVPLLIAADDAGPASVGAWRTCVVVPASLLDALAPTELRLVLLHELMHCRRRDVLVDRLAALVTGMHWFNPFAWFALARLRAEREMACDAAVLDLVGERQRGGYGQTVLNVMARCVRPAPWPGLVGFGQRASMTRRILDIASYRQRSWASTALAATVATALLLTGFTSALEGQAPAPPPQQPPRPVLDFIPVQAPAPTAGDVVMLEDPPASPPGPAAVVERDGKVTITGQCLDGETPVSDARVRVFRVQVDGVEQVLDSKSDEEGRFTLAELPAPSTRDELPRWYYVIAATSPGRATGVRLLGRGVTINGALTFVMPRGATLRGRVTDPDGKPVPGAYVSTSSAMGVGRSLEGILGATTDGDGRFEVSDLRPWTPGKGTEERLPDGDVVVTRIVSSFLLVNHPDFARTRGVYRRVPSEVNVTLQPAATIVGVVFDEVGGEPAAGVTVSMQATNDRVNDLGDSWQQTMTDDRGHYKFTSVSPGKFNIWAEAEDRTCAAVDSLETTAGQQVAAPFIRLIEGGWIEGTVVNGAGKPFAKNAKGEPVQIGIYGPSRPRSGAAIQSTKVDEQGHFKMRAAPGTNYPYICSDIRPMQAINVNPVEVFEGRTSPISVRVMPRGAPLPARMVQQANLPAVELPLPIEAEREAAEAIRKFGGWYKLDDDKHVVEVNMVYYEDKDGRRDNEQSMVDSLEYVKAFPQLKTLLLKDGQATDAGLTHLRGMDQLEKIFMWDASAVTDAGAAQLAAAPNLSYIHLSNSQITDEAIRHWQALPKLYGLSLQGNLFSDKALEYAAKMPNLRELFVGGLNDRVNTITDAGLAHLAGLATLERLDVQKSQVTDAGLAHLAELKRLRMLWLSGTRVTRAGLATLKAVVPGLNDAQAGVTDGAQTGRRDVVDVAVTAPEAPKLAYLAWQIRDEGDGKESVIGPLWSADGSEVDPKVEAELQRLIKYPPHNRMPEDRAREARPLVLFFADNSPLERRPVTALIAKPDGRRLGSGSTLGSRVGGFCVSTLAPSLPFAWEDRVKLQIQCVNESPRVIKELREIPAEPVKLDGGVEWIGRLNAKGRLETVLSLPREPLEKRSTAYSFRIYGKGNQWPTVGDDGGYTTIVDERTTAVEHFKLKPEDVDLVRFLRQGLMSSEIDDVPVRLDLLRKAEEAAAAE